MRNSKPMPTTLPRQQATPSPTILIIDDNPKDMEYWSTVLRESPSHYTILNAQTVRAGLDCCQQQKINCVVLDLDMGDSSGFEVLLALHPNRKPSEIAVVVLTRLPHPALHETVLYHGAQAVLVKQVTSLLELDAAIQKAIVSVRHFTH